MALLAGPKRKQKLGVDPNNTNWVNDSSAFGQSLLKKMGWTEGKGLGANEDGRTVPVKASLKIDNKGLGCTGKDADAWIAHREEFDEILAALNQSTNSNNKQTTNSAGTDSPKDKKAEGQRRFYGRFSRGGVKTLRTTEDLDCIMGRRKRSKTPTVDNDGQMKTEDGDTLDEEKASDSDKIPSDNCEVDKTHGFVTKTSSCSVQDYFAQKMKNKTIPSTSLLNGGDKVQEEMQDKVEGKETYTKSNCSVQEYFAQRMRTKRERLLAIANGTVADKKKETVCEKEHTGNSEEMDENGKEEACNRDEKKKCAKKLDETEKAVKVKLNSNDNLKQDTASSQKKERKKRKRTGDEDRDDIDGDVESESVTDEKEKSKKIKIDPLSQSGKGDCEPEISRKKNKKDKKKKAGESKSDETENLHDDTEVVENSSNSKKKRKSENKDSVKGSGLPEERFGKRQVCNEETCSNDVIETKTIKKKMKKKKTKSSKGDDTLKTADEKMAQDAEPVSCDDLVCLGASVEEALSKDNKPDKDETDLLQQTKNAKKKMRYKSKLVTLTKLEELKVIDMKQWMDQMESMREKMENEVSHGDLLRSLRVKMLDKAILERKGDDKSSKKRIKTLAKEIEELKKTAEAMESVMEKVLVELETLEAFLHKKIKKKTKKNICAIKAMAAKEKKESNNKDIDWDEEIGVVEKEKKRTISALKRKRKEIEQGLKEKLKEFPKAVEDLEQIVLAKMEHESSAEKQNSVFPGAIAIEGYKFRT